MKKTFSLIITTSLLFGNVVFAQEAVLDSPPAPPPPTEIVESTLPAVEVVPEELPSLVGEEESVPEEADVSMQETYNEQDAITADVIEDTVDPGVVPVEESAEIVISVESVEIQGDENLEVDPVEDGSASEEVIIEEDLALDIVKEDIVPEIVEENIDTAVTQEEPVVKEMLKPEPEVSYVFALSGKTIPTKRKVRDSAQRMIEEEVAGSLSPVIDTAEGVVTISGSCSDVYYVVLLFKNETDYEADPRSFIVNRAYPCEGGTYSYSIDNLPVSIQNGTYYMLVGEQGERGAWRPITGLTEITINRNQ